MLLPDDKGAVVHMKKSFLSILLAVLILVGLLPGAAFSASAASTMTASKDAVTMLKNMEGYLEYAQYDNGQYTIGYGTRVEKDAYPDGITREEAEVLFQKYLAIYEKEVNSFADKYGVTLSQRQFDALVMFSFNVGNTWITDKKCDLRDAVVSGKTGNDFIYYLTRWCKVNSETVSTGLIGRRLAEANVYLNGVYATSAPAHFGYVLFDGVNGTSDAPVQGYDTTQPVEAKPTATRSGYTFLGWYTAKTGGKWVDVLDSSIKGQTLYAHWQTAQNGGLDASGNVVGTKASYHRLLQEARKVYFTPSTDGKTQSTLAKGTTVSIVADYIDGDGNKWGNIAGGGWIQLSRTTDVANISVSVTASLVNFRSGAGMDATILGSLPAGTNLVVTQVEEADGELWGKFSYGWVCLKYTSYAQTVEDSGDSSDIVATGKVITTGNLCVRSNPGTTYTVVGTLPSGTQVNIYEITANGNVQWGRISSGWICLTYVNYTRVDTGNTDKKEDTGNTDKKEDTGKTDGDTDQNPPSGTTGEIRGRVTASQLNIRKNVGASHAVVGYLNRDDTITITEQKLVGNVYWGKIEKGWVCMTYVQVETPDTGTDDNTTGDSTGTSTGESTAEGVTGVVTASNLCVRKTPGTDGAVLSTIPYGSTVTILQQTLTNGTLWGQISSGWICMNYVKITAGGTNLNYTGIVTASSLVIRNGAGTTYTPAGTYARGERIVISELKKVDGTYWAHTAKGWVCMNYVQLVTSTGADTSANPKPDSGTGTENPETENPGTEKTEPDENTGTEKSEMIGVVTASNLCVRSNAGTASKVVTSIPKGTQVKILQQTVVSGSVWGRIEEGWICMSYVSITSGSGSVHMTGTVTASELCIRSGAGTGYAISGAYNKGDVVEILETSSVGTKLWGHTAKGWICLDYVRFASAA